MSETPGLGLLTPYILHILMLPAFFSKIFHSNHRVSDNKDDNIGAKGSPFYLKHSTL